jgi:hypothetical protein
MRLVYPLFPSREKHGTDLDRRRKYRPPCAVHGGTATGIGQTKKAQLHSSAQTRDYVNPGIGTCETSFELKQLRSNRGTHASCLSRGDICTAIVGENDLLKQAL